MKAHYTYELIAKCFTQGEPHRYIGVRSCDCLPAEDDYWGSSKYLPDDVRERCRKIITGIFATRKAANEAEIDLHDKYDVARNPNYWNRAKSRGNGFCTQGNADVAAKISDSHKGKSLSPTTRIKIGAAHKGKTLSAEHCASLSKANRRRWAATPTDN